MRLPSIIQLFRYLFRPPTLKKQLPLLSRSYTSDIARVPIPAGRERDIALLIGNGLGRTPADAARLLAAHPGERVENLITAERRVRKHESKWQLARERVKRIW
jgi:hypothetical protein